ncbi:MAG: universal stress protein [Thermoleophilia bacterium]|nr:universal stress protein [Thermoleophilia bacterium]
MRDARAAAIIARAVIFDRVICAVDGSEEALVAVHQAARLVSESGRLLLAAVAELPVAAQAGWAAPAAASALAAEAREALERAHREIAHLRLADTRLLEGPALTVLADLLARERATLLCLGTHGRHRAAGILIGSVTTESLHGAPCAVLVARAPARPESFPASVVVGVDGSPQADAALAVAESLRDRFGAGLRVLVSTGGKAVDPDAVRQRQPAAEVVAGKPVDALLAAAGSADLIVVGSRGLHGLRALGSVSERLAHRAGCSVLVVR